MARIIFRQLIIGLSGLKQRLILHRDIKPANILVSDNTINAKVYIADFGISAELKDSHQKKSLKIGTPGFRAPEVLKENPYSF